jgi:DHA1 family bicyclomycin/chloramphenicol resistance-like MFS transporter
MSGLAPISIHILLPVLPEIERAFASGSGISQLTLSLGLVAMAVSTIAYGPAADRFGRKPVLLFGLAIFIVGSLLCFWSPNIDSAAWCRPPVAPPAWSSAAPSCATSTAAKSRRGSSAI